MKNIKDKINSKVVVIILAIILVIIALSTATYALFYSESSAANENSYSTGLLSIVATSKSENISLTSALPLTDEEGINSNPYTFTIKNIGNLDYNFSIKLLSTDSSDTVIDPSYIKLKVDDGEVTTLSALTNSVIKDNITLKAQESVDINIRIWLSIDTPNSQIGKVFNSKIVTEGQAVYTESNYDVKASTLISSLYKPNTTAVNNGITYNLDSTNNLMKDVAGNIRYYGANPSNYIDIGDTYKSDVVNRKWEELSFTTEEECKKNFDCSINYARFGFSSEDECNSNLPAFVQQNFGMTIEEFNNTYCVAETIPKGTPILYRIIGVFGDKIKIIRNESIGKYSWDTSASDVNSGYGVNEWSGADLMKLINPGYESESIGGSLWYNSGSGTCYNGENNASTECDFTGTGLSDNVKNKIAEVTWNLGGWKSAKVYPNQIYEYERGTNVVVPGITCSGTDCNDTITRTTSWTGKVALAYPSDYGYAADLTQCSQTLYNYDDATCKSNNWLYNRVNQWLLTPYSSQAYIAWLAFGNARVCGRTRVLPVLYLNSDTGIVSGSGTEADPYRIS